MVQCVRTTEPSSGVSAARLVTYSRLSVECAPVDLETVSDSYSTTVMRPPHFSLSTIMASPSWMRYVRVSIRPCPSSGPSVYEYSGVCVLILSTMSVLPPFASTVPRKDADYLHASLVVEQSGVIGLGELPHPLCHGQLVYPTLDTAQRRLRRHSVPEHAHLAEPVQVVPAEFYYFGTRDMLRGAAEHHQHYDVGQSVADVPLVRPAEIGDGRGEFYQFFQNAAAMDFGFVLSL